MAHGKSEVCAGKLTEIDKRSLRDTASTVHREVDMAAEIHCQLTDSQKYSLGMSKKLHKDGTSLALGDDLKNAKDKFEQALRVDEKAFGNGSSLVMEDCYALKMIYTGLHQIADGNDMSSKIDQYLQATKSAQTDWAPNHGICGTILMGYGQTFMVRGGYCGDRLVPVYREPSLHTQRYFYDGQVILPPTLPYRRTDARYPYPGKK
ncbi:MAG: hypothetical protein K2X29_13275 [Candidatus Obscuribacterales bacterium]|nr:hypothetical protein [Candidatus Obscuribacterales bacterium]